MMNSEKLMREKENDGKKKVTFENGAEKERRRSNRW
jgi:hypothetical protein